MGDGSGSAFHSIPGAEANVQKGADLRKKESRASKPALSVVAVASTSQDRVNLEVQ